MIRAHLSYCWHRLRSPRWLDFVDIGLGIEHRERRFRGEWAPHLARSRGFVQQALAEGGEEVVVLGAGRLFDVPIEWLVSRFSRVVLVDVDPRIVARSLSATRRFGTRVEVQQAEVTGVFSAWTQALESVGEGSDDEIVETLCSLKAPSPFWSSGSVVSMNLLSQLGVMWRDRVQRIVGTGRMSLSPIAEATAHSIIRLEKGHASGLAAASQAVLLADRFFITASEGAVAWEVEDALYGEWPEQLPGREAWLCGSWLWHLVPMSGEVRGEGSIHEVWARAFRKR